MKRRVSPFRGKAFSRHILSTFSFFFHLPMSLFYRRNALSGPDWFDHLLLSATTDYLRHHRGAYQRYLSDYST